MLREICQHGHDITNKTTSTGVAVCPEGCLSNDQPEQHKRVWTGPGELERTGYIDPQ